LRSVFTWGLAALSLVFSGAPWIAAALGGGLLLILWLARRGSSAAVPETGWLLETPAGTRDPLLWCAVALVLVFAVSVLAGQFPMPSLQTPLEQVQWRSWGKLLGRPGPWLSGRSGAGAISCCAPTSPCRSGPCW
jgi:hypothetical protein